MKSYMPTIGQPRRNEEIKQTKRNCYPGQLTNLFVISIGILKGGWPRVEVEPPLNSQSWGKKSPILIFQLIENDVNVSFFICTTPW